MITEYSKIVAKICTLTAAMNIISESGIADEEQDENSLASPLLNKTVKIGQIGGVIMKQEQLAFMRNIFRTLRGKATVHIADIPEQESDELVRFNNHSVFIVIFHYGDYTYRTLRRICENFSDKLPVIDVNHPEDGGVWEQIKQLRSQRDTSK